MHLDDIPALVYIWAKTERFWSIPRFLVEYHILEYISISISIYHIIRGDNMVYWLHARNDGCKLIEQVQG